MESIRYMSDGTPVWNYSASQSYPVVIRQKGVDVPVNIKLSPYEPAELKEVLKKLVAGYKNDKRNIEIYQEDSSAYNALFDAHFEGMDNTKNTTEQVRDWFDKNPQYKASVVTSSFGNIASERSKEADEDSDVQFDITASFDGVCTVFQTIWDEAKQQAVKVTMAHNYAQPTEAQFRTYRNARRRKFLGKNAIWTVTENHDTLEKLYDNIIRSIGNASVGEKLCSPQDRAEWLGQVPLWHKLLVCDQIFGEVIEKNA